MRRRLGPLVPIVAIVVVAAVVGAACSSSGGSAKNNTSTTTKGGAGTTAWNSARLTEITALAAKLNKAFPKDCKDFAPYKPQDYLPQATKFGPAPLAAGACSALTERLEFVAVPANIHAATFVDTRGGALCKKAVSIKVDLPGLYWVVGPDWTIQPDSEGVARRIAPVMGGKYRATACAGQQAGWDLAGVAAFQNLATKLEAAHLGCQDFQLRDRDLISHNPFYAKLGLPSAFGECTLTGGAKLVVAILIGASPNPDHFVSQELANECPTQKSTRVVRSGNAAIFAPNEAAATKVAGALGVPVDTEFCS